jgi:hypothetical protein
VRRARSLALSFALLCAAVRLPAQGTQTSTWLAAADAALAGGNLYWADSVYYGLVRARPRDPLAREALGKYLGMRGAWIPGAVLLEEARTFGGDATRIARELVPLYQSAGNWRALLTLPASALSQAERKRAAFYLDHPPAIRSDTTASTMVGAVQGDTLGRVAVRFGRTAVMAAIVARNEGIRIGRRALNGVVRVFGDSSVLSIDSMSVGAARLSNAPATLGDAGGIVTIGISALESVPVTFDFAAGKLQFDQSRAILAPIQLKLLRRDDLVLVLDQDHGYWVPLAEYAALVAKAKGSLTVDLRAGVARVQR